MYELIISNSSPTNFRRQGAESPLGHDVSPLISSSARSFPTRTTTETPKTNQWSSDLPRAPFQDLKAKEKGLYYKDMSLFQV